MNTLLPSRSVSPTLTAPAVPAAVSVLVGGLLVIVADSIGGRFDWAEEATPLAHLGPPIVLAGSVLCALTLRKFRAISRGLWRLGVGVVLSLLLAIWISAVQAESLRPPVAALPKPTIQEVRGICLADLRPSSASSRSIPVELTEVRTQAGWKGSAEGRVRLIWSGPEYLTTSGDVGTMVPNRGDTIAVAAAFPAADRSIIWSQGEAIRIEPAEDFLRGARRNTRGFVRRRLARLPQQTYTMALALLLGTRGEMSPEMIAGVRNAGASHVIALSGMHLGVLALLLSKTVPRVATPRVRDIVIAAALIGYVWIAGWIPSLVRALILACLILVARDRDRSLPPEILLSRCVLLTAIVAPRMVWALGFQLSLWALVGLFFLSPRMVERLSTVMPYPIAGYIGLTLGPLIATAPVSLLVFGTVYPVGLVSAGVLALVAVVLMWSSLAFIVLAPVPVFGTLIAGGLNAITGSFVTLSAAFAAVPAIDLSAADGLISAAGWCTLLAAGVGSAVYLNRRRQRTLYRFLESHGKSQLDF